MDVNGRKVLLCNCEATMPLDPRALGAALETEPPTIHTQLCRSQIEAFRRALKTGEPLLVGCTQEAPLFGETAEADGATTPLSFMNIRERAGWSDEAGSTGPKIAALVAEAAIDVPSTSSVSLRSTGVTLVYGRDERAIEVARRLRARLDVTVLLTRPIDVAPPRVMDIALFKGTIRSARGHLGAFEITVDDYAAAAPSSRGALVFPPGRNGASSRCDVIIDLSQGQPLFPAPDKRDGYRRVDPNDAAAVERLLFEIDDLVGEFDKPRYVTYDASLCAHSRSRQTGCTRCLDVCPTGAITPDGDTVAIDPFVCAGCGSCAATCPTGAATYAMPAGNTLFDRLRSLARVYRRAGGSDPVLLVHDMRHGEELIATLARHGSGLPARVIPFAVNEVTQVGFDFLAAALAFGFVRVDLLMASPHGGQGATGERDGLDQQVALAHAALAGLGFDGDRVRLIDDRDPDVVARRLRPEPRLEPIRAGNFLPLGGKRAVTMLALRHLHDVAPTPVDVVALDAGSPFGAVVVDAANCTLCLACVGACPTGALIDNPDKPMLRFQEEACVQCGLCRTICPEKVITLHPRLNFTEAARSALVLKEEEPAECIRCGKAFGSRASIERIVEKLAGRHAMFASGPAADLIRMCEDCRVISQFEAKNPMAGLPRPAMRTTEDDLLERARQEALSKAQEKPQESGKNTSNSTS